MHSSPFRGAVSTTTQTKMSSVQLASPVFRLSGDRSPKEHRTPRDERLKIPRKRIATKPVPLQPVRQAPLPPATQTRLQTQNDTDDQYPKSPEVVEFGYEKENSPFDSSRKRQDGKRLTDHSERTVDIIQYYLTSGTPNPPPTPSVEIRESPIAAFDFGFPKGTPERSSPASREQSPTSKQKQPPLSLIHI